MLKNGDRLPLPSAPRLTHSSHTHTAFRVAHSLSCSFTAGSSQPRWCDPTVSDKYRATTISAYLQKHN